MIDKCSYTYMYAHMRSQNSPSKMFFMVGDFKIAVHCMCHLLVVSWCLDECHIDQINFLTHWQTSIDKEY